MNAMNALPALPEGLSIRATTLLEKHETPALVYEGDSWFVTNAMHRFSTTALVIPNIDKHGLFIDRHGEVKITPPPEDPAPKGVRYEFRRKIARGEVVLNSNPRLWYHTTIDSPDSPNWNPCWVAVPEDGYRVAVDNDLLVCGPVPDGTTVEFRQAKEGEFFKWAHSPIWKQCGAVAHPDRRWVATAKEGYVLSTEGDNLVATELPPAPAPMTGVRYEYRAVQEGEVYCFANQWKRCDVPTHHPRWVALPEDGYTLDVSCEFLAAFKTPPSPITMVTRVVQEDDVYYGSAIAKWSTALRGGLIPRPVCVAPKGLRVEVSKCTKQPVLVPPEGACLTREKITYPNEGKWIYYSTDDHRWYITYDLDGREALVIKALPGYEVTLDRGTPVVTKAPTSTMREAFDEPGRLPNRNRVVLSKDEFYYYLVDDTKNKIIQGPCLAEEKVQCN